MKLSSQRSLLVMITSAFSLLAVGAAPSSTSASEVSARTSVAGTESVASSEKAALPPDCKQCIENIGTSKHYFDDETCVPQDVSCGSCGSEKGSTQGCHSSELAPASCWTYHAYCTSEGLPLEAVSAAISRGRVDELVRAMKTSVAKANVGYNPDRNAVQVVNCRGLVIGSFSLTGARQIAEAEKLPTMATVIQLNSVAASN